ncbi:hypothetical protein FHW36_105442 [Chitinophaga polysaccharea]|uniref:Transporter n=1 Tax=Chitinophaga polysaccharea TaxID=1293035 RepID=A0A561PPH1_9BACT|nr:transporter [Chitinophaga polysaccharea]TWF40001.1 hypothetical protein FHW36_105442 [Chitinophaga polysaccharea]
MPKSTFKCVRRHCGKMVVAGAVLLLLQQSAKAQGCVAIRSTGTVCMKPQAETGPGWQVNMLYRYFKSFRHFVGTEEQKERLEQHTEVINWQHTLDLSLVRVFNSRWSLAVNVPVLANTRSSLYEHYGNNSKSPNARQQTHSFGIGDIRFAVYRWLLNPARAMKGNIQAGLGLKLPTGDYQFQDYFVKNDSTRILGPVDQSIQLGDGGTGFTTELNGYYNFSHRLSMYGSFYYLFNPREQNGVSTARGGTASAGAIQYGTAVMSVPDQYMVRLGANYSLEHLTVSAGIRRECIPAKDLIGGSSGFRRPGYVVSAEPGLSYKFRNLGLFATVPMALKRNRTQSYGDKLQTQATGVYKQGDAAFADYSVNIGMSIKL